MLKVEIEIHGKNEKHLVEQLKTVIKQIETGQDFEDCIGGENSDEPSGYRFQVEGVTYEG